MTQFGNEVRTALMVWRRELIRFTRSPARVITGFVQPILLLFVLGYGLGKLVPGYQQFIFPGAVAMNVITTAIFSGVSIVWDREFGFLREMLVAPVSRSSILAGKVLGGAVVATLQGCLILVLAPVVGVSLGFVAILQFLGGALLMAVSLTAFGVFVASRMKKIDGFQAVMQFLLFPMIFLSGSQFPLQDVPLWLAALNRLDPLTYAVDPLRRILLDPANLAPDLATLSQRSQVQFFGETIPMWSEFVAMALFAALFFGLAVLSFRKAEQ